MTPTPPTANHPLSRRAFSLIELLIVILIIALIIAIVLPALAQARKAARKAATTNLMSQVQSACSAFNLSERRPPGYFSAQEMGSNENGNTGNGHGFTGMENVLFDLAGGIVPTGTPNAWPCGPTAAHVVLYSPDMVGVAQGGNKSYFTPPSKYFQFQDGDRAARGLGTKMADPNHKDYIRDLVDAEGTPILLWSADPMAIQPVATWDDFAATASDTTSPQKAARFYWSSNAAFLASGTCGAKRVDEAGGSLIGSGVNSSGNNQGSRNMLGVLGNPSSPVNLTPPAGQSILPSAARGQFIIQSAGSDGIFVANMNATGAGDRGGKLVGATNNLDYGSNFRGQSKDLMSDFDDILVSGS